MSKGLVIEQSFVDETENEDDRQGELIKGSDKSGEQTEETIQQLEGDSSERLFEVDLSVKLQPVGEKAITIPLIKSRLKGGRVSEILNLALKSRRNLKIIDAVLDLPEDEKPSQEVITRRKGKQKRG